MVEDADARKRQICAMKAAWNAVIDKTGVVRPNERVFHDCIVSTKKPVISR